MARNEEAKKRESTRKVEQNDMVSMLATSKMLLGVLLTRLRKGIHSAKGTTGQEGEGTAFGGRPTFAGFPTFCPMTFHLLFS